MPDPDRTERTATFNRPMEGKLGIVFEQNGRVDHIVSDLGHETLARFGLIERAEAYRRFTTAWHTFLGIQDSDELTDAGSMLRYLVECAICYDDHTAFDPTEIRPGVVLHWVEGNGDEDQDLEADAEAAAIVTVLRRFLVKNSTPAPGTPT